MVKDLSKAVEIIKSFEGILDGNPTTVNLDPYLCPAKYWTIGWGHVVLDAYGKQIKGQENKEKAYTIYPNGITMVEAEILLLDDVRKFSAGVEKLVDVPISNTQFCALVSFSFNIGLGAFKKSTLLTVLNQKEYEKVAPWFMKWNKSGGKVLAGLTRRRKAEKDLWLS